MQHAEVYDGHKHALTIIDTTFKKHNTNNANNKNVQLANINIQLLQAFSKQKNRWNVYLTFYQGGQCRDIRQRHYNSQSKNIRKTHLKSTKNRARTTALTYYCVNKILAPTHTKGKVCAHIVVGRC